MERLQPIRRPNRHFFALDQQRTSNAANEITAIGATVGDVWQTPAYDGNGNMTTIPKPSNMTAGYGGIWDAWNRLVALYDGLTRVQGNAYDGLARRTKIILPSETLDDYYTASWQLFQEDSTVSGTSIFYWGLRYIDDLIARYSIDSSATVFSLTDANWNVVAIADTSAAVLERYAYTPYGVVQFLNASFNAISESAYGWETLYSGYRYDTATGCYKVRRRELQPILGFWLGKDPKEASTNPFGYCSNCPTTILDPSGLEDVGPYAGEQWSDQSGQLRHGITKLVISIPCPAKAQPEDIEVEILRDLAGFKYFNGGHNNVATVKVTTVDGEHDVALFRTTPSLFGYLSDVVNSTDVAVAISVNTVGREVSGQTLGAHQLVGIRRWRVSV